ncbi:hypothetical protein [Polaribacter sargassicola]|uniref:hypothetical protein n=1 Tax=Polaribacter sargassicola TaxID=2836891 RepID=UPI001F157E24|nr:hypothetical protein [Polaribacter sp. DS7-9]MCG1034898.1 hypothetical protein [Polaribacter sp. DS7-9]
MKNTFKKSLVVALMFGTLIGYAKDNVKSTISNYVDDNVKIVFKSVKKGQALTIENENGLTVYKEKIKNTGNYSKTFDLTNLEDGLYTTQLEKDFESVVTKIKIENGKATFLESNKKKIYKPIVRTEKNMVLISKIALDNSPLSIDLYYNGNLINSETLESKDGLVNRVYKLSETEKGDYQVIIKSDNKVYTKDLTI